MIDESMLAKMKPSAALLNFSRAELCDGKAVAAALAAGKLRRYVVDFPTEDVLNAPGRDRDPAPGASTPESEDNCADMAAKQTRDYLMTGASATRSTCRPASWPRRRSTGSPSSTRTCRT